MDNIGPTGAGRGAIARRQVISVLAGKKYGMGRLLRTAVLVLVLGASLASTTSTASAQVINQQCNVAASNQVWCQGQYVGTEYQYGLWMGSSYTAISNSVSQVDTYWWNSQQWTHWQTTYHELHPTSSGLTPSQLNALIMGNTSVGGVIRTPLQTWQACVNALLASSGVQPLFHWYGPMPSA